MNAATPLPVIAFPDGVAGFEACRRFLLVTPPALAPFTIVQHADGPLPAIVTIDPSRVEAGYRAELSDDDRARLNATPDTPLLWLAMVSQTGPGASTVNLQRPLVINPDTMTGVQITAPSRAYSQAHPLRRV
jgi:flagellar assembly factor FliW